MWTQYGEVPAELSLARKTKKGNSKLLLTSHRWGLSSFYCKVTLERFIYVARSIVSSIPLLRWVAFERVFPRRKNKTVITCQSPTKLLCPRARCSSGANYLITFAQPLPLPSLVRLSLCLCPLGELRREKCIKGVYILSRITSNCVRCLTIVKTNYRRWSETRSSRRHAVSRYTQMRRKQECAHTHTQTQTRREDESGNIEVQGRKSRAT